MLFLERFDKGWSSHSSVLCKRMGRKDPWDAARPSLEGAVYMLTLQIFVCSHQVLKLSNYGILEREEFTHSYS